MTKRFYRTMNCLIILLWGSLFGSGLRADVAITLDGTKRNQTIQGFGTCLYVGTVSPYDTDAFRTMYAQDIGASLLRVELSPQCTSTNGNLGQKVITFGTDLQANIGLLNFNADPVKTDGSCAKAILAKKLDSLKLIGSLWTPPHWMKTSDAYLNYANTNSASGHLKQDAATLQQFGRYVAAYVKGFEQKYGVPFYAISIQNELRFAEPYNSCVYTPTEYVAAIKAVGAAFQQFGITTKLMGPEDVGVGPPNNSYFIDQQMSFINPVNADPNAKGDLNFYCIHGYAGDGATSNGSSRANWTTYWNDIKANGKESWMTEGSGEDTAWLHTNSSGNQNGAMTIPLLIHEALVYGNCSAWVYWQMADGGSNSVSNLTSGADTTAKKYNAAKHFFRYIRPGAVRINAAPDNPQFSVSAYVHDANGTLTIVLLNTATTANTANMTLLSVPNAATFQVWRTSASETFAPQPAAMLSGGKLSVTVPAQSVVTLYGIAPATVSGTLTLEGIAPTAAAQNVTFTFRPADNSGNVVQTANVGPNEIFTLAGLPRKSYTLHIKGDKYLAANVPVDASGGNVSGVTTTLFTGDADNNNSVDVGDFGLLVNAYGNIASDPNGTYDIRADFNGDGMVDIGDFGLLLNNYNTAGAP